ncbi:MAG: right-handed parallel beta-helix repeat-containing protein [Flavobacteriales bacterium]|nr:right-handed parallel beta-helix repeat-containing protein [Flavobacteriales bacterium]
MKKKYTQFLLNLILTVVFGFGVLGAQGQSIDTVLFDYDDYFGCTACGDGVQIASTGTKDSLVDATPSNEYVAALKVKVKLFTCYSGNLYLLLNGVKVDSVASIYNCFCNACDSLEFNISGADIDKYYNHGQKNVFRVVPASGSTTLYFDRSIIFITRNTRINYDAAITGVDSPSVRTCAGSKNIVVEIANKGRLPFTGLDVLWTWNGAAQSTVTYSGTLDTLNGSGVNRAKITLGSKTFTVGKQDTLVAWSKDPGGITDSLNFNDTIRQIFNGSYKDTITVGGSSPDFSNIQSAVNALMQFGVCGPTYVSIRPGSYNEQISIGPIPGASTSSMVKFFASNGDSSSVSINFSANSTNRHVVQFLNANNIVFERLTIEALNSSYPYTVYLFDFLKDLYFKNCHFIGSTISSSSTNYSNVFYTYSNSFAKTENLNFVNCQFSHGSHGIYLGASSSNKLKGLNIRNCVFRDQYYMNTRFHNLNELNIDNSIFERSASTSSGYGIYISGSDDSVRITNNRIIQLGGCYSGIYVGNCYGTSNRRNLIANNFITAFTSGTSYYNVYLYYSTFFDIFNNNLYQATTNTSASNLYTQDGSNNRLCNNILVSNNGSRPFIISNSGSSTFELSDNNDFFNSNGNLGNWEGKNIISLSDLHAQGHDSNSVAVDPNYSSNTDLHVYHVDLDGKAKPFSQVTYDIDGQMRNSSTPDIGADEFKLRKLDAGLTEVAKVLADTQCVKVVLKNFGDTTITSTTINWVFRGASQSPKSWTGSLAKGDTTYVCLGTFVFHKDSAYELLAWTSAPNGGVDSIPTNDTTYSLFYPAMNGIYTIGGSSPDFSTFSAAVAALNKAGIKDSVKFLVRNGTYTEQISIGDILCADHKNSVIFESESGDSSLVILEYGSSSSSKNYVVELTKATGITFRHLTLRNSSSTYKTVVNISEYINNICFEHVQFENNDSTSTSSRTYLVNFGNGNASSVIFANCFFNRGSMALYLYGSNRHSNIQILSNKFRSQRYYGLYAYNHDDLKVTGNDFYYPNNLMYVAAYLYYLSGNCVFSNNKVFLDGPNAEYAVYCGSYSSNKDIFRIFNNFITLSGTNDGQSLYEESLNPGLVAFNNILSLSSGSGSYNSALYNYSGNVSLYNNNIVHQMGGYAFYNDYSYIFRSDNNNFFTNGSKFIYIDGNYYSDLPSYISGESLDSNSISTDPIFENNRDLHVSGIALNKGAMPVSGIMYDIDHEMRDTLNPDIGADEFTPLTTDIGVSSILNPGSLFLADTIQVKVVITNFGVDTVKSFVVQAKVNSDTLPRVSVSRNIASGDTVHVTLSPYIFVSNTLYDLLSWTSSPNGTSDQKVSNDTLRSLNRRTALSGVYTIGGSSPDFPDFKSAVAAMISAGIIDSVKFKVRSGTYTEQISIPPITGAMARNSIIFESETLDSSDVILTYSSTDYDTNYVVQFSGCDGVTFRKMTLEATSNNYGTVFNFRDESLNILVSNNMIIGPNSTGSTSDRALLRSDEGIHHRLHILNNTFVNGDMSIYIYGYNSNPPYDYMNELLIANNNFTGPYYYGMLLTYLDSVKIHGNNLFMDKYSYSYGFYLDEFDHIILTNNKVNMPVGRYGFYLYDLGYGSASNRGLVANNSAYVANNNTNSYGFYMRYSYYNDILHNTAKVDKGSSSNSYGFYLSYGSSNTFYNNNITNFNSGYAFYSDNVSTITNADRNNYFTNGSLFNYNNGNNYDKLSDWTAATQLDSNSISSDPLFTSVNDLHAKEIDLNGSAMYFARVPFDIDLEPRDTLNPDIGADEFQLPLNDAGISRIIVPKTPFLPGNQQVEVVLRNYGNNTLYTADINWVFNDTLQTPLSWSDTLVSGDTAHIKLGLKTFLRDSLYSLVCWSSQPNGTVDSIAYNDTAKALNQYPALSGVYTIGGASPDFNTFEDAVNAMKRGGIYDSVLFNVRNGTYTEQILIPYIKGANRENSIIFQSEQGDSSKVILLGTNSSSKNYTVYLDSTRGVTFRKMTLKSSSLNSYNTVFYFNGGCSDINIHDCYIKSRAANSTSTNETNLYFYYTNSNHQGFENINIYNNIIIDGAFGIYCYTYSNTKKSSQLNILRNKFINQYYYGIYTYYIDRVHINYNEIYNTKPKHTSGYGVISQYSDKGFHLIGNNIYNQEYYGVYLYNVEGTTNDTNLIINNFIHSKSTSSALALYIYSCSYINVFNNNVHQYVGNSSSYAAYFYSNSRIFCSNNNFINSGSGYSIYVSGSLSGSNFNNFYSNGSILSYYNNNLSTLGNWQSYTGFDANSLNIDPSFVSSSDLHVRSINLDGAARNIPYLVMYDIDMTKRDSLTPDIGADEFDIPAANDAGMSGHFSPSAPFTAGNSIVKAYIKNFGSDTLKSATLNWKVNGNLQSTRSWTGSLAPGESDTTTVGNFNFLSGKEYEVIYWTTLPNGQVDTVNYNDTFTKKRLLPALKGVYTVEGTLPDFTTLADALAYLEISGASDTVWFKLRAGTYNYRIVAKPYPGAHPSRPIYIESQNGDSSSVVLRNSYSYDDIIRMEGADYLHFRKLTFKPSYYYCVGMQNGSQGLKFSNCRFVLDAYYYAYGIRSNSDADDSLEVRNCQFDNGGYGVYCYGGSSSVYEKGMIIEKCLFNNQNYYSIYVTFGESFKIKHNTFNSNSNYPCVYTDNSKNNIDISYNKMVNSNVSGDGLYCYRHTGTSVYKGNIYNNFISIDGSNGAREALYLNQCTYLNVFHNSINVYGTNTSSSALYLSSGSNFDIRNNIFSNPGGGYSMNWNSTSVPSCDYNDLFTGGTNLCYLNGSVYTSLSSWRSASFRDSKSISLNPSYTSNTDLHCNLSSIDSSCLPISVVTDDIDLDTRNTVKADMGADEFNSLSHNLGVSKIISPVNSCGLDSTPVKLQIFNFGNLPQGGFSVRYRINGGSIISTTVSDTIQPGKSLDYTFTGKEPLMFNTLTEITAWTDLTGEKFTKNDTLRKSFTNYTIPDTVKFTVPFDSATGVNLPVDLSWLPSKGATYYDLYYWEFGQSKPSSPNVSNLSQISYRINSGIDYGTKYSWQVVAKNAVCSTPGLIKAFTTRHLPDLIVEGVTSPKSAFSSTSISISWKIKNTGLGNATGLWYDGVYLSKDAVLDVTDTYLGAASNPSALTPGQSYSNSTNVTLPNGVSGNYYIFIKTDNYNSVLEVDNNNNSARDTTNTVITLTPPPDLVVTSVTRPSTAFSGTPASTVFTVKNQGTGDTRSGGWYDRIYLSNENVLNGSSVLLKTLYHAGNLKADSTYQVATSVIIPNYISGRYYFVVNTDQANYEYEHSNENNNTTGSDSIKVILTPPPDLIARNVVSIDTASNYQIVDISFNIINDGGTKTNAASYSAVFLCPNSTFDKNISHFVGYGYHGNIESKDTSKYLNSYRITKNISGTYYIFVIADYFDYVNEVTHENNNVSPGTKIFIKSPDLIVSRVVVQKTDTTGSMTPINYTIKNIGEGVDYQGARWDSFYISKSPTWNKKLAYPIGRKLYSGTILPADSMNLSISVKIPDGYDSTRYFYVFTDIFDQIYEYGRDTNNYRRSNSMFVELAPYPDLIPKFISYPDSAKAGDLIEIDFEVLNAGKSKANPNWKDQFYFSTDSVYNPAKLVNLGILNRTSLLEVDSTYGSKVYFSLPGSIAKGKYYYYLFADKDMKVYEHYNDSNNIVRSNKIFIDGYPPIDLKINCPSIQDSMYSGNSYALTYTVTNKGQAKTPANSWNDAVYLSKDSILDNGDQLIATLFNNLPLEKDSSYTMMRNVLIPNGTSGKYYLIVKTDVENLNKDIDLVNNVSSVCNKNDFAKLLTLFLTDPPDLQIVNWNVPGNCIAGQPVKIIWTVENKGIGTTRSGAWKDEIYLSTDYSVDKTDLLVGTRSRTGNLNPSGSYKDSLNVTIPINKVGNFIVLIRTDGANVEYEHLNEGNNLVSSILTSSNAPPADLIVSEVISPDSVLSGNNILITWKVKNIGTNPASGVMYDNVYLSVDDKQGAGDVLLGSVYQSITLTPNSEITVQRSFNVSGVSIGNYHVLVTTDGLNNIFEQSDTNNTGVAANLLNVNVPELFVNVKKNDSLFQNRPIYYRIEIPGSLFEQSLLITLKADSINGDNQLYVKHGEMVSGSNFDFKYREPFEGNQEIIIPSLDSGTYYLLITGKTSTSTKQYISTLARILPFEIRSVKPVEGGNTGEVTLLIEGSKFDDETTFSISKDGIAVVGTKTVDTLGLRYKYTYEGSTFTLPIDPTMAFVTFDLNGMDTGDYDVIANKIGETAVLKDGFKVVEGIEGLLTIDVISPENTRNNNIFTMEAFFTNTGNIDIVGKKILINSTQGAPISLTLDGLGKNETTVEITVQEENGPPNRLRPKGQGSVLIYSKASGALGFTIID